jgi:hypothetical protein
MHFRGRHGEAPCWLTFLPPLLLLLPPCSPALIYSTKAQQAVETFNTTLTVPCNATGAQLLHGSVVSS